MELYRRGDSPYWYYDVTDPKTGKRTRRSTGEAVKRRAMERAIEATSDAASESRDRTLEDAGKAYVLGMKADGKKSWREAERQIDKTLGRLKTKIAKDGSPLPPRFSLPPSMLLVDLTKERLNELRLKRAEEGNGPATIAAELRILRAVCLKASEDGYAPAPVKKWGIPEVKPKLCYLSPDEAQRVLRRLHPDTPVKAGSKGKLVVPTGRTYEARQDTHDLFLALILTGGRWNEVAKLLRSRIDLARGTVTLFGWKGEKERTVPLVPELREMFARRLARPGPSLVFPGKRKGDGSFARASPTRAIRRAMTEEGCNAPELVAERGRATNHSLRHTYASWLRQKGLGLDEVQPLLGHAHIKTTMIYAKVVPAETLQKASEALSGIALGGTAAPANDTAEEPTAVQSRHVGGLGFSSTEA